ncbi:MAG: VOC family protein [Roseivirga sp.]|nr:VOC family protein [Roseivirga sp.]
MQTSRVIYFEIPATRPEDCMKFYQQVFGWQFSQLNDEAYWLTKTGSDELPGINGAIKPGSKAQPSVINTIQVTHLERTILAIEQYGGQLVSAKQLLPGIGKLVYFKDPDGNVHGALQTDGTAK